MDHCNGSYDPYVHIDMNHDTLVKQRNNGGLSVDSSNDKTHGMYLQQNNAWVDNPTVPIVEDQTGNKNAEMSQSENDSRPKVIWTRSGQLSHRPQRLEVMEEQEQSITHLNFGMCTESILDNVTPKCCLRKRE